jgi:hypothetical protein
MWFDSPAMARRAPKRAYENDGVSAVRAEPRGGSFPKGAGTGARREYDWKPHDKSMIFGYLTHMVATIPSWIAMEVTRNELDVAAAEGPTMKSITGRTIGAR